MPGNYKFDNVSINNDDLIIAFENVQKKILIKESPFKGIHICLILN